MKTSKKAAEALELAGGAAIGVIRRAQFSGMISAEIAGQIINAIVTDIKALQK